MLSLEQWFAQQWYERGFNVWQLLLRPLAFAFGVLSNLRRQLYIHGIFKSTRIAVPVIVIGNITVGGTGKSPLVIALTQKLKAAGWQPGVISRGYGAAQDEPKLIEALTESPVVVNRKRVKAALALLAQHPEVNVIISDDGLQHHALQRDMEIVVVDGARGFGNGRLLPAGPLREPVERVRKVACIVCNGDAAAGLDLDIGPAVFPMQLGNETFASLTNERSLERLHFLREIGNKRVHAMAGIGNPQRFFSHLDKLGVSCAEKHIFADHFDYQKHDLDFADADIILMTEKDAVKCTSFADSRMWMMRVDALLPEAFFEFIVNRLQEKARHVT